ncbi:hypothetical protein B0T22DRAFT_463531 [Podospora appendiculata]|uniref:Transcription factor domain-containing protein n=1 Tax=Podospora appendiculata TaxID=314037 RepID=A0AAE1CE71_9PEZI|nr:hypothetical protein B0T22DRAFT_463531 [Podospora appendiculata]
MADIADAFYRNALGVFADLVMRAPSLLSVQALLAMAVYVQGPGRQESARAFFMLATNAARQLEVLGQSCLAASIVPWGVESSEAREQFRRVVQVVRALEVHASSEYGISSVLACCSWATAAGEGGR